MASRSARGYTGAGQAAGNPNATRIMNQGPMNQGPAPAGPGQAAPGRPQGYPGSGSAGPGQGAAYQAPGYGGVGYATRPVGPEPLSPAITAIVTVLFCLIGLIPCLVSTSRARRLGRSTRPHWLAFIIPGVLWLVVIALLLAGMGSFAGQGSQHSSTAPSAATSSYSTEAPSATSSSALSWPAGATECSSTAAAGNDRTSCEFALNVADAWLKSSKGATETVTAHSPVTNRDYSMTCTAVSGYASCTGGDNAVVYVRG